MTSTENKNWKVNTIMVRCDLRGPANIRAKSGKRISIFITFQRYNVTRVYKWVKNKYPCVCVCVCVCVCLCVCVSVSVCVCVITDAKVRCPSDVVLCCWQVMH